MPCISRLLLWLLTGVGASKNPACQGLASVVSSRAGIMNLKIKFGDYGMILVLIVLILLFSLLTVKEVAPSSKRSAGLQAS